MSLWAGPTAAPATAPGKAGGGPLDVTIKGETKDKIEIQRVSPIPDVLIKDVIPFSRLGQTDWVLTEELGYMDEEKQIALMDVRSPKTFQPSMIDFPKSRTSMSIVRGPFFFVRFRPIARSISSTAAMNCLGISSVSNSTVQFTNQGWSVISIGSVS